MPFAYYDRLSPEDQAVYRASDAVTSLRLERASTLAPVVAEVKTALSREDRGALETAAARLTRGVCAAFGSRPPRVEVLDVRPTFSGGELHGLYTLERPSGAKIRIWMRTARYTRVVAFKTFLRTLLHEIGHHLDLHVLRLPTSFHTEGFFKRESALFHQLVPDSPRRRRARDECVVRRSPDRHGTGDGAA